MSAALSSRPGADCGARAAMPQREEIGVEVGQVVR